MTVNLKVRDSDALALHKAFDLLFKLNASSDSPDQIKPLINEISIDLHVSSQMVLLYPDIDSENSIKNLVHSFNKLFSKMGKLDEKKHYSIIEDKKLFSIFKYNPTVR